MLVCLINQTDTLEGVKNIISISSALFLSLYVNTVSPELFFLLIVRHVPPLKIGVEEPYRRTAPKL